MKDLIILVADQNMRDCIGGLIPRFQHIFAISPINFDIFVHTNRDPGCRTQSSDFLKAFQKKYRYSLIIFDKEGCGKESLSRTELEAEVERSLSCNGWANRSKAIVIDPELENWIWIKSRKLAEVINWKNTESLYQWLAEQGYMDSNSLKPNSPKEAFEKALYISKKRRSSSIYKQIASQVSFKSCSDLAFLKLKETITNWFSS